MIGISIEQPSHRIANTARILLLGFVLLFFLPGLTAASSVRFSVDRTYSISDIVCIADAVREEPAPEPTAMLPITTVTYLLRVRHVWKGDPPDSLWLNCRCGRAFDPEGRLTGWGTGGVGCRFEEGRTYLVFAYVSKGALPGHESDPGEALPRAGSRTSAFPGAVADLRYLLKEIGPGVRRDSAAGLPDVSYRRLLRDFEEGTAEDRRLALGALYEMSDSSGAGIAVLRRVLENTNSEGLRRGICNTYGAWAAKNGKAFKALVAAMGDSNEAIRLSAVEANGYPASEKLWRKLLERTADPSIRVRVAALRRCGKMLGGKHPPLRIYLAALQDTSAGIRYEGVHALGENCVPRDSSLVMPLLRNTTHDPDAQVAGCARQVLNR
jgi:hypothetical protein